MFCEVGRMQLSAASLLIAAQQSAKPQPQQAASSFASAMGEHQKSEDFAPIDFKQPAKPQSAAASASQSAPSRMGAAIDIRV
jgi:hypothetical protein